LKKIIEKELPGRKVLWVEPSHFRLDNSLHKMADLEVSRQLAKRRISTFLVVLKSKSFVLFRVGTSQVSTISIPIKYVPIFSSVMYAIAMLFYLPLYIIILKPSYVVAVPDLSIISFIPISFLSKFKKIKFILDIRSVPVETFGFIGFLQRFWFTASIHVAKKFFNGITTITSLMKADISSQYKINPKNMGVWTSGVSTRLFLRKNYISEGIELRTQLGLSNKFIVFYHGVFTASRGLKETVQCIAMLKDKYPDIVFFLLGKGSAASMLTDLVNTLGLKDNVIIHDPVVYTEVPKFIEMSDACIVPLPDIPYWRTQSPLKLLEYLAMEKVVIITDIHAHRLVIGKNTCGVYVSSVSPSDLAKSIIYVYNNKEQLNEWGKSGRTIVNENYTWEKVTSDLEKYLMSL
jgi:glycosyltransferase involved in cell wall biosynthesis